MHNSLNSHNFNSTQDIFNHFVGKYVTYRISRYQHKKIKCTGFYISLPRMKEWDFLIKTLFAFCRYFQYELNYAQFTVSLIRDFFVL